MGVHKAGAVNLPSKQRRVNNIAGVKLAGVNQVAAVKLPSKQRRVDNIALILAGVKLIMDQREPWVWGLLVLSR